MEGSHPGQGDQSDEGLHSLFSFLGSSLHKDALSTVRVCQGGLAWKLRGEGGTAAEEGHSRGAGKTAEKETSVSVSPGS